MAKQSITTTDVSKAHAQLQHMRGKLVAWLKYRKMNDEVVAGTRSTRLPRAAAAQIASQRDWATEQQLANYLYALLSELAPDGVQLPHPDVSADPNAAVKLATIAITGTWPGGATASPDAMGSSHPWLWPVLIVGAVLLTVTTAISSYADVAKTREQYACIQAGACTDYGFYLKWGAIVGAAWFVYTQTGVGERIRAIGRSKR